MDRKEKDVYLHTQMQTHAHTNITEESEKDKIHARGKTLTKIE